MEHKNKFKDTKTHRSTNSRLCDYINILDHNLKWDKIVTEYGKYFEVYGTIE